MTAFAETVVTRMWWIRHAPVTCDGGRVYGALDLPCDVSLSTVFDSLAGFLPREAQWVTSHLRRAKQTAAAIRAAGLDFPEPAVEPDLGEQSFGEWQGRLRTEVYAEHGDMHQFWLAPAHTRPPGGESFVDLVERVSPVVRRLVAGHAGADICIVAHGGTIRAALALALGLAPERALAFSTDNCAVTRIDHIATAGAEPASRVVWVNRPPV